MGESRNTRQKELLEEEVKKFSSFFIAEELLARANKRDPQLGIATVYRFLNDLKKKRKIHTYVCDRRIIYSIGEESRCHFTCEKCGKVEHIKVNSLDFIKNKIEGSICHFQIDISGVCDGCKKE